MVDLESALYALNRAEIDRSVAYVNVWLALLQKQPLPGISICLSPSPIKKMNLIRTALRRPITILVIVAGIMFFGIRAVQTIKIDIFPAMNLPVIYLSHPYGGFTPSQMEGYF